ncbi:hypothetical protein [Flavobacterium nitrogenifigens]|uniref:Uncharacterized protein n=1 Tax=Flavobacterium nitrogenifigens TaxID=1617283 RepID=A0A521CVE1_9FLAO|nr:hypothetical protein [Flavobacterium nitrogenifigens]KAF2332200.1 hypothetical protein DM397_11760 [Flavobacterium nitrogenifigens]SMO63382.1 hypothetical protein SAMN06265220_102688 [Flavobacterium nitrogenifigens]
MKTFKILLTILVFNSSFLIAQDLKPEYQKFISKFILEVKNSDKEAIAKRIKFPFKREYPIPSVKDKADFVKRYNQIFDKVLIEKIAKSDPAKDWSEVGWRGIMLNQGDLWIDTDGRIISINHQSDEELKMKNSLIAAQKKNVNVSISNFKEPVAILETSKFRIRIDDLGNNNYRYVSWGIKNKMTDTPDLVIEKGVFVADGTGGNHHYEFKKGNFKYECHFTVLGEKNSAPAALLVYQSGKEILSQDAKIVSR